MIRKTIKIPIYGCKIIVILDEDINEISKTLYKKFGEEWNEVEADGLVMGTNKGIHTYYLLLSTKKLDISLFTHETIHLCTKILTERGHDSLKEGDEPLAYLSGYIAEEVYKVLLRNNIEINKPKIRNAKTT